MVVESNPRRMVEPNGLSTTFVRAGFMRAGRTLSSVVGSPFHLEHRMEQKQMRWRIAKRGCHICTSHGRDKFGYPRLWRGGRQRRMARYVFETTYGPIPPAMVVCHACDNPACVNPDHLFLGTVRDNVHDRDRKGRQVSPHGEHHWSAKLTTAQVIAIRRLATGVSCKSLATRFGVSPEQISRILTYKSWGWLRRNAVIARGKAKPQRKAVAERQGELF